MDGFNVTNCFQEANNTGYADCVAKLGAYKADIFLPLSTRITGADSLDDTLLTFLTALLINDSKYVRGYPIGAYVKVDDSSTEPVTEGFDQGIYTTLYDGAYTFNRRFIEGALCQHSAARKFNGKNNQYGSLMVFSALPGSQYAYHIMGTKKTNVSTGEIEMAPVRWDDIWADKFKIAEGNTSAGFYLKTNMGNVRQINEDRIVISVTWDALELPRVQSVSIKGSKSSTGVFDIDLRNACSGLSLTDLYPALADDAAFTCTNQDGAAIAMTGVTIVNGKFRVAVDTSDTVYTAATGIIIGLQPISVTSASPFNIEYIEAVGNTGVMTK